MRRPGRLTVLAAGAALLATGAVSALSISDEPAVVSEHAARLESQSRALLVSDSAWLGMKTYGGVDSVQGFEHELDLASCRRRVTTSCTNYNGFVPIPVRDELAWRQGTYDTLIMATGYNDSDHDFRDDVADLVELTRRHDYRRIVWLTLRSNVTYTSPGSAGFAGVFARNNQALRDLVASGAYPEIVIADWATYARDQPEWFSRDGIHLRNPGAFAAGDYISRKMAFLDDRPCPQPLRPGIAPASSCPDPDATGPIADLDALYPIGETWPRNPFELEFEGSSSWPDPPWWAN